MIFGKTEPKNHDSLISWYLDVYLHYTYMYTVPFGPLLSRRQINFPINHNPHSCKQNDVFLKTCPKTQLRRLISKAYQEEHYFYDWSGLEVGNLFAYGPISIYSAHRKTSQL